VKESKKRVALLPLRKKLSFSLVGSPWLNDSPASSGLGVEDLRFQDSPSGLGEEDPQSKLPLLPSSPGALVVRLRLPLKKKPHLLFVLPAQYIHYPTPLSK